MTERSIQKIIQTQQQREGGGFIVRRPLGNSRLPHLDPFLMLDHMGPVTYAPGEAIGAPDHPHRGFETVTYILHGGFHHKDSVGNEGRLRPGWVQWMTAGSGVIHSEMPVDELLEKGGLSEGFQLWVNLPAKDKMIVPRYQDTPPEKIPKVKTPDNLVEVVIIAGESLGVSAVIETRTPILYLDIHLTKGGFFQQKIPQNYNCFGYIYRGKGNFGLDKTIVKNSESFVLDGAGEIFTMEATEEDCSLLLLGGCPINEPIVKYGPFVMNTQKEIQQAFSDFQNGNFGKIKGQEERFLVTEKAKKKQEESNSWNHHIK